MKMDFLKRAKKSEIMVFLVMACIAIIAGYYFLFLSSVTSRLSYLFRETGKLQDSINKAELAINSLPKIKKEIEGLKSKEGFYGSKLPREEEFPAILESLSTMAKAAGVKITKLRPVSKESSPVPESEAGSGIYRQRAILINANSGYHQLGTFISELEGGDRFMEISDIKIEAGRANPKRHEVQLVVKAFVLIGGGK